MPVICLVGPHAVGKTTAVKRWVKRYSRLKGVLADNQLEITQETEERVLEWKHTAEDKKRLVEKHSASRTVSVLDSVRTTNCLYIGPEDRVIVLTVPWEISMQHLKDRCKANGKKFNAEYWTPKKVEYESSNRYLNFMEKNLDEKQYAIFNIRQQAKDWKIVDKHFGQLYRSMNNGVRS